MWSEDPLPTPDSSSETRTSMKSNNELRMRRHAYHKGDESREIIDHKARIPKLRRVKKKKKGKKFKVKTKKALNRRERWRAENLKIQLAHSTILTGTLCSTIPVRSEK